MSSRDPSGTPAEQPDELSGNILVYFSVGAIAGAVIALQIAVMRVFSIGSWAHFGSLVVSLAMLAFGLTSAVMCVSKSFFDRRWKDIATVSLLLFGPLVVICNLAAQALPFNAIFLISDPTQKWRLAANFVLYLIPFLAAAIFLGTVFLRARSIFSKVYFADLTGSGIGGLIFLLLMFWLHPQNLVLVPVVLCALGAVCWFVATRQKRAMHAVLVLALVAGLLHEALGSLGLSALSVSDYKGVSYARKFPDSRKVMESKSPFGLLEIYASSYLHFAPGLSDNAAFSTSPMPDNSYLGLYVDGEGPSGIIRSLPAEQQKSFRFMPMFYPYLLKETADVFVSQFGGGLSTTVALASGAKRVTVAEGNPAILSVFRDNEEVKSFTGNILQDPRVAVVDYDGRLFLAHSSNRYDVVDLSLADSAGLSSPGGFAIVEKFAYTREAMATYMRALKDDGILSVTIWNKEEPPKSVLRLYATMVLAAQDAGGRDISRNFFVTSTYLSAATVLYKRNGFSDEEVTKLRDHTATLSFDEIYYPGASFETVVSSQVLEEYRAQIFGDGVGITLPGGPSEGEVDKLPDPSPDGAVLPATTLGRFTWQELVSGSWTDLPARYVFDLRPLTNDRPYFAAYIKTSDLPRVLDRLEILQDEWGYLVVWATLGIAVISSSLLVLVPLIFGWRTIFGFYPGKLGTIVYFACLGLGYIMVEVGMISIFIQTLSHVTVSASLLITAMLIFSGAGSYVAGLVVERCRQLMPVIFVAIGSILLLYGLFLGRLLDVIGGLSYGWKLSVSFLLAAPPAFLMGFPMATAMTRLGRLGKDHMFVWAWGINGCFSVTGAALVPIIATSFGLSAVLFISAAAYFMALPAFFSVLKPLKSIQILRGT